MKCPNCSKELLEDAVFCGFCGTRAGKPTTDSVVELKKHGRRAKVFVRVLLLLLFLVAGGTLGFLAAKNENRIREFLGESKTAWSQSNESYTEEDGETDTADLADEKDK